MRKFRLLALLASFSVLAQPIWASTVIYRTDAQLVALSERVVHGRVIGQRTARGGPGGRNIYTVTTIQIIEDLTGIDAATVDVWELGGRIADEELYVGGAVRFSLGQEVLVCLERGPQGLRTVAMGFSTFDVLAAVNGERRLRRNLQETLVVGGAVAREPFLSEMRTFTTRATGRPARPGRQSITGGGPQSVVQPYTLLGAVSVGAGGFGNAVTWYINTSAASPLTSRNIATEMQTALSAWTSPASASIVLQYGGTTFQSDADGPFSGLASAAGVDDLRGSKQPDQWLRPGHRRWLGRRQWRHSQRNVVRSVHTRLRHLSKRRGPRSLIPSASKLHESPDPRNRPRHWSWPYSDRRQHAERDIEHHVPVVLLDEYACCLPRSDLTISLG